MLEAPVPRPSGGRLDFLPGVCLYVLARLTKDQHMVMMKVENHLGELEGPIMTRQGPAMPFDVQTGYDS